AAALLLLLPVALGLAVALLELVAARVVARLARVLAGLVGGLVARILGRLVARVARLVGRLVGGLVGGLAARLVGRLLLRVLPVLPGLLLLVLLPVGGLLVRRGGRARRDDLLCLGVVRLGHAGVVVVGDGDVAHRLDREGEVRAHAALGGLRGLAALGPARERSGLGHPLERPPEVLDGEEVLLGPVEGGPAVEVGLPLLGEPGPALLGRVLPRRLGEAQGVVLPGAEE